jgi:hypothetical protein
VSVLTLTHSPFVLVSVAAGMAQRVPDGPHPSHGQTAGGARVTLESHAVVTTHANYKVSTARAVGTNFRLAPDPNIRKFTRLEIYLYVAKPRDEERLGRINPQNGN